MKKCIINSRLYRLTGLMGRAAWLYYAAAITASTVMAYLGMLFGLIGKDLVDCATQSEYVKLWGLVTRYCAIVSVGMLVAIGAGAVAVAAAVRIENNLRRKFFAAVLVADYSSLSDSHSGDLVARLNSDIDSIMNLPESLRGLAGVVLGGGFALVAIFVMDWRLGIYMLIAGAIAVWLNKKFSKPLGRVGDVLRNFNGVLTERLSDIINGIVVLKIYCASWVVTGGFSIANSEVAKAGIRQARLLALQNALNETVYFIGASVPIVGGVYIARNFGVNVPSLGTMVGLYFLFEFALGLFVWFGGCLAWVQESLAAASRIFETLNLPHEQSGTLKALPLNSECAICFDTVGFSYGEGREAALHDLSFTIKRNEVAALTGANGSGKSTIMKLIQGLYHADSGTVRVAGAKLEDLDVHALRDNFSYLSQDGCLFTGTVADNIRLGRQDATPAEIETAAQRANAREFILQLPDGYATQVGERGTLLSGGQRQRIAIARAFLKDAPVLLLDEPTAALDAESEGAVMTALTELMRNRTALIIAHRLETVKTADNILVLENGQLTEQGKHEELLARADGVYRKMYYAGRSDCV